MKRRLCKCLENSIEVKVGDSLINCEKCGGVYVESVPAGTETKKLNREWVQTIIMVFLLGFGVAILVSIFKGWVIY